MKFLKTILFASLLAACHHDSAPVTTTPPQTAQPIFVPADAHTYKFAIGSLTAYALKDGSLHPPNDGSIIGKDQDDATRKAALAAAGKPTDTLDMSIQPLLVVDGDHVLLFDTGAQGMGFVADGGQLQTSLAETGVKPDAITDIFISHTHGDHTGGLVTKDGALAFPKARIHMTEAEWAFLQGNADAKAVVAAITPQVDAFKAGAQVLPEVTAVDTAGHTPGHSSYLITSGSESLFYTGDTMHESVLSVQHPDWTNNFDGSPAAIPVRQTTLKRLADEHLRAYAVHFPFPGLGHIAAQGTAFVWEPEAKQ